MNQTNKHSSIFSDQELIDADVCPNCWGEQEFDNVVRDLAADKQIDINNHTAKYSFIKEFMVTQLSGIRLRKELNGYVCPACHTRYQEGSATKNSIKPA